METAIKCEIEHVTRKQNGQLSLVVCCLQLPLYAVISFGLISLGIICYRVTTFRDCPEAAEELQLASFNLETI